ncbi:MAG: hypothetical protein BGO37_04240 [Cellulomonas sp. 73-92]|uniref:hypothetical protein n=1 Tax=Cellulomonas sp. 73-92 TaxID=1895740 RepID=UPI00092859C1|nr:hypothetical protein [Cellulomonas sp. 73-92]OJV82206.1 MAG: hypothetical protein BGO37_04240 [Cellulomonas sp. 73-92]
MRGFLDARRVVQLAALALAAAAAAYLLSDRASGATTSDAGSAAPAATLVDVEGRWVIWLLLTPVLLVATHALWRGRGRTAAIVAGTTLLFLLCVAGALTIGIFFMPAALVSGLALLVPARTTSSRRNASAPT